MDYGLASLWPEAEDSWMTDKLEEIMDYGLARPVAEDSCMTDELEEIMDYGLASLWPVAEDSCLTDELEDIMDYGLASLWAVAEDSCKTDELADELDHQENNGRKNREDYDNDWSWEDSDDHHYGLASLLPMEDSYMTDELEENGGGEDHEDYNNDWPWEDDSDYQHYVHPKSITKDPEDRQEKLPQLAAPLSVKERNSGSKRTTPQNGLSVKVGCQGLGGIHAPLGIAMVQACPHRMGRRDSMGGRHSILTFSAFNMCSTCIQWQVTKMPTEIS